MLAVNVGPIQAHDSVAKWIDGKVARSAKQLQTNIFESFQHIIEIIEELPAIALTRSIAPTHQIIKFIRISTNC